MWSCVILCVYPLDDCHLVTETCSGTNNISRYEVPVAVDSDHVQTEIISAICTKILFVFRSTNTTTLWILEITLSNPYKSDKVEDDQASKVALN
jgi:hypothetical protein